MAYMDHIIGAQAEAVVMTALLGKGWNTEDYKL